VVILVAHHKLLTKLLALPSGPLCSGPPQDLGVDHLL